MYECIKFAAQLAENFPWDNMEKEVDGTIFSGVFREGNELFWSRLNEALELYKVSAPLRCAEILDFIGRYANQRPNEITLSHYKDSDFSRLALQYYEEAVKQKKALSVLQVLILMDIAFESRYQPKLSERSRKVLAEVKKVYLSNAELEKQYVNAYHYLWPKGCPFETSLQKFNLL